MNKATIGAVLIRMIEHRVHVHNHDGLSLIRRLLLLLGVLSLLMIAARIRTRRVMMIDTIGRRVSTDIE